jgi:glycosyltransferase involved in cell wall biosynthesis
VRVLCITKIFPNVKEPLSSPFNRQQLGALARQCEVEVLATIPWFPGARAFARGSAAGRLVDVPRADVIDGIRVRHPRFLYLPKAARSWQGPLYAGSLVPHVLPYRGRIDVVLGAWAYPDGWASVALARLLGVPAVVKIHGSDLNVIARMPGPRAQIQRALPRAARVVVVSRALGELCVELGVARDRIDLVANGVDGELFCPRDRVAARTALGLPATARLAVYVGRLEDKKGTGELLDAFAQVAAGDDRFTLALIGDGAMRGACEAAAARAGDRLRVLGPQPLAEIPTWLAACDVLTLPSWNEGTPNVVLEALARGRRVVATTVGGIPDLITDDKLGTLVPPRDAGALATALAEAVRTTYDGATVARAGSRGDWQTSAACLRAVLERAITQSPTSPA